MKLNGEGRIDLISMGPSARHVDLAAIEEELEGEVP